MYNSWSSKNPQSVLKNGVGIGSNRQVVGFTWEKIRPSVLASTRAKLSSVSSGKINDPGVLTFEICWGKRLDLMSLILLLKWSAKSSQRASIGVLEDLWKFLFVKMSVVEKRNFWLFLSLSISFWKWEILDWSIFLVSAFLHGGVGLVLIVFIKSGATESSVDFILWLKLSTIKSHGAGKISAGVLCKIWIKFAATSEVR